MRKRSTVTQGQMEVATEYNCWTRGETGVFSVLGKLFALKDKRPYYGKAVEAHGDD